MGPFQMIPLMMKYLMLCILQQLLRRETEVAELKNERYRKKIDYSKIIQPKTKREPTDWMIDLANRYGIEAETVLAFFNSIIYDPNMRITKRKRTEEFFELYFEGKEE